MLPDDDPELTPADGKNSGTGAFFVVDRRALAAACALGLNATVAYLAIARGAGSRARSFWSIHAIEQHTGISRSKAKTAVDALIKAGLLIADAAGARPSYGIVPAHELVGALSAAEREVMMRLAVRPGMLPRRFHKAVNELESRGYIELAYYDGYTIKDPEQFTEKPQHVWLPNAIVDGAADETPPLEIIRQMQDVRRLQLFVSLYDNHDLPEDGGVSRRHLWQVYELIKVGERGLSIVWGFAPSGQTEVATRSVLPQIFMTGQKDADGKDPGLKEFWDAIRALRALGLIDFIPHVFESDGPDAEMLHAYPLDAAACEQWELDVAPAAHAAGAVCLTSGQREWAGTRLLNLLPARAHMTKLAVIGIARLRYRPRTRKTAAWFAKRKVGSRAWQAAYEKISAGVASSDNVDAA